MLEKTILDKLLRRIKTGGLKVTYWDGDSRNYGPEPKPSLRVTIKKPTVIRAMAKNVNLGVGESYMSGDLEIEGSIEQIMKLVAENQDAFKLSAPRLGLRRNTKQTQARLVQHHYDVGNDFYKLWLDKAMVYSCAYFKKPTDSLDVAQQQKLAHTLAKLRLQPGHKLLDIGSGWGDLLLKAAREYGVTGLGVTLSKQQVAHANQRAKAEKLDHLVQFKLQNFQDIPASAGPFDRIVSVGSYEHVGRDNQSIYFDVVDRLLKPGGISLLHTISKQTEEPMNPWIDKYIFPGTYIPAVRQLMKHLPQHDFRLLDYESLRPHYALTLGHWQKNYEGHKDKVINMFDQRFYRMWLFYLATVGASFTYGILDLSQLVFSKGLTDDWPLTRNFLYK